METAQRTIPWPALLFAGVAAFTLPPVESLAQVPGSRVVSPDSEKRIAQARERGFWIVEEGDYLYRIARAFVDKEADTNKLVAELRELNRHALMNGADGSKLVVGARIFLPQGLVAAKGATPTPSGTTAPVATLPTPAPVTPPSPAPSRPLLPSVPPSTPQSGGVPPIAAGAPPEPAPKVTPPPERPAYVDRIIAGMPADDRELGFDDRPRDGSPGLRQWAVDLRSEHRDVSTTGSTQADGIGIRYAMETERYGDFALLGQVTHFQPTRNDPRGERTLATGTLLHENFAIASGWIADSAIGVVRPILPPFLVSSYRVNFTPSMLSGIQTSIHSARDEVRVGVGRIGQLSGFGVQQFERTSGEQATVGYARRLDRDWSLGAAAIGVRDSDAVQDHATATIGINREYGPAGPGIKAQVAMTDDREKAGWFDIQMRDGRLVQRFGAFHIDPDFLFGESGATRDTRGAYWRGEYRATGNFYSFGAEATSDNLRRQPNRGGSDNVGGYGNATLRLDRTMQLGGGLSLRQEEPRTPTGVARRLGYANAYFSKTWDIGVSRLDANVNTTRPSEGAYERTSLVGWNQEWPRLGPVDFSTLLSQSDEDLADRKVRRRLASISARGPLYGNVRWDASYTFVDVDDTRGSERNYNASVAIDWSPAPAWTVQLLWFRNQIQPGADNPLAPFIKENSLQLNARYEDSSGSPYPRVAGGRSGTGRLTGSVFFDENNDGVRQANERGAAGVQVVLNERQAAITDADGRYVFPLVPSGPHRVRIVVERVPLPWGLDDDSPREVRVDVRTDARLDFGLSRISP